MKKVILFLIRGYQKISILLPARCRFYPSCSEYAYQAISQYGLIRGGLFGLKRLLRCHPLNLGGYDPVKICGNPRDASLCSARRQR